MNKSSFEYLRAYTQTPISSNGGKNRQVFELFTIHGILKQRFTVPSTNFHSIHDGAFKLFYRQITPALKVKNCIYTFKGPLINEFTSSDVAI